jgi:hydrogenase maturation protease
LIVGIGNEFRSDDGIGIVTSRKIKERIGERARVIEHGGDGVSLMEEWKNHNKVILIDAVAFGGFPGTIFFIDAARAQIPNETKHHSSHLFGIAEAIETARVLKSLPSELYIYGIEGHSFELGTNISKEVMDASDEVINKIISDFTT